MPLARLQYNRHSMLVRDAATLADLLPSLVAQALSCEDPGGQLEMGEVDTEVTMLNGVSSHTKVTSNYDYIIVIEANEYPSRKKTLEQRTHQIAVGVRKHLFARYGTETSWPKGGLWVRLCPGEWVEL